jgi:hypothetical protein
MPLLPFSLSRYNLLMALVVMVALATMAWAQYCGLLLTHDSHQYLAAAQSFAASRQFTGADGAPITYWPPLFPIILSMLPQPVETLRWMHLALLVAISWQIHQLAAPAIGNNILKAAYMMSVLWGVHLMLIGTFVWSELIFVALLLAFVQLLLQGRTSTTSLVLAIVVGIMLCLQRHAGVFVAAGATGWLWLQHPNGKHLAKCAAFFLITTLGFWLWNIYVSYVLPTGFELQQHDFGRHVVHNLQFMAWSLLRVWAPLPEPWVWPALALGVAVLGLFRKAVQQPVVQLAAWITGTYLAGMALLFKLNVHDGDRYVAVIVPLMGAWIFAVLNQLHQQGTRTVRFLLWVAVAASLLYGTSRTIKNVRQWHRIGCLAETAK